ncbi:MAG: hypothetical protein K0U47_04170 [Epsilonproteobacteria bacterium]|nr:hypothetical protein [Campylobacterota bacterium]
MQHKRFLSILVALSFVAMIQVTNNKGYDATSVPAINSDLVWLSISSFKQINKQMQECTYKSDCDK